jgi:DNA polymerase III epsilon subunit-like protein
MNPLAPWTAARWVAVDVEGNGQRPPDLVEIAVVAITCGEIGQPRSWLVRPARPIMPMARRFHQIADADVADAPAIAEIAGEITAELDGAVFVAHNAHVDLSVIMREIPGYRPVLGVADTLKLSRRIIGGLGSYKLSALVAALALSDGLPAGLRPHRAEYDALVCARLLRHLAASAAGPRTAGELLTLPSGDEPGAERGEGDAAPVLF